MMKLSWSLLERLAAQHGDAFILADVPQFISNCHDFIEAFRQIYPRSALAYSYKTNYLPAFCIAVDRLGGYAEVVSRMEYDLAVRLGVRGERIIFNGPLKTAEDIEMALTANSTVNLDCLQEIVWIERLSKQTPARKFSVGLRCNFDVGTPTRSRFGLSVDSGELNEAVRRLRRLPNVRVSGLHCHFSTPTRSVAFYELRTRRLIELADKLFGRVTPDFLDVGGGFFGHMPKEFARQFDCPIPDYAAYARAVACPVRERYDPEAGPTLIIEPGAAVVADVMKYVGRIVAVKNLGPRRVALVVGSVHNVRPTLSSKRLPVELYRAKMARAGAAIDGPVDLVGYTCMEHDCLLPDYPGRVAVGDFVVFGQVGAYTLVFKPPFIRPNPPILGYGTGSSEWEVLRREETFADVFVSFPLPEDPRRLNSA